MIDRVVGFRVPPQEVAIPAGGYSADTGTGGGLKIFKYFRKCCHVWCHV